MKTLHTTKGISLVEVLISIGIFSILVVLVASLFVNMSQNRKDQRAQIEVAEQGSFLMSQVTQGIRNSTAILSPGISAASSTITIQNTANTSLNPTVFQVIDGALYATYGSSNPVQLSSGSVIISNLNFLNITPTNGRPTVRITFSVSSRDNPNVQTSTLYSTVTTR